jgi:hypothetical protein
MVWPSSSGRKSRQRVTIAGPAAGPRLYHLDSHGIGERLASPAGSRVAAAASRPIGLRRTDLLADPGNAGGRGTRAVLRRKWGGFQPSPRSRRPCRPTLSNARPAHNETKALPFLPSCPACSSLCRHRRSFTLVRAAARVVSRLNHARRFGCWSRWACCHAGLKTRLPVHCPQTGANRRHAH